MLIDVGVPRSTMLAELAALGIDARSLTGAVLNHAHGDHANPGALAFLDMLYVPVRATLGTWAAVARRAGTSVRGQSAGDLQPGRPLAVGGMTVHACRVSHDNGTAGDAVCCRVETGSEALGYATDLGTVNDAVIAHLRGVGLVVLESNHDVDMLAQTDRPRATQAWIRSERGHLRNEQTLGGSGKHLQGAAGWCRCDCAPQQSGEHARARPCLCTGGPSRSG
jgi:phosphoribosyl 1,2-cyclic phosphodiesterase